MSAHLLTDALISDVATDRGAWTREQLGILGVPWPPPQGWRKRLVAEKRILTDVEVEELREARTTIAERRSHASSSERATLPCPWCREPVEQKKVGPHVKTFCDTACRNAFNNALGWLGRFIGRCATEPGLLQAAVSCIASIVPRESEGRESENRPSNVLSHCPSETARR